MLRRQAGSDALKGLKTQPAFDGKTAAERMDLDIEPDCVGKGHDRSEAEIENAGATLDR